MNGNFSDVVCQPIVSHGNNQGCGGGGGNDSVCAMGRGRGFCEVKVEESKSENVSCEQFTPNLGDTASDGNFPEVNYWAYNNNFLFPPHLYKRLFEQAIFHKRNYLPTKQEKALIWENPSGVVTSINCGVREKCDNNSSAQKGEDQKDFTSSMNSVMTDHHMPSHGPENNHIWSRGDLGKLRGEHGSSNEMTRKDDDQSDHHMTNAIYPGTAMRSASVSTRSMSPQHGHAGPPAANGSHLLGLPQPLDATKIGSNSQNGPAIGGRKYHCKICSQIFGSKADLQLHTQIHMREAKPYKCSQCAKAFANSSYLSQHTRIHLGIKPYRCEICQRKFTQLSHLQQHIRTHTGDKPYKCRHPGCQKAFSQLSNLQSHSRCHQTDKPYKCNSCYKCFSDEPSLLEHIPKHKESKHLKTHICQYCGKSYTQETYLSKHMQKHAERTDKRPPITTNMSGLGTNRNVGGLNTQLPAVGGEHPYWPKVSPDSAASLTEVIQQQQQQQHNTTHHDFHVNQHQNNGHADLQQQAHHRSLLDNHPTREDVGEDLVVNRQQAANALPPSSTPTNYEASAASITKTAAVSNSAFTPINSMTPHLNSLGHHHQLAQRPYLYDAISFQNKNVNQNAGASFPNQLISLHQIRNYAHQPGGLMAGEHLLGVSVGAGKDKG